MKRERLGFKGTAPEGVERKEPSKPHKTRLTLINKAIERAKRTRKPQKIVTEFEHGTIREVICPETLAPRFRPMVTKSLVYETRDGKTISIYKELPRRLRLVRGIYNVGKLEREQEWEKIESIFEFNTYWDRRAWEQRDRMIWKTLIEYGDLTVPKNMLSFLHEIGHSDGLYDRQRDKIDLAIINTECSFKAYNEKVEQSVKKKSRKYVPNTRELKIPLWDDETEQNVSAIVPRKEYKNYVKLKANDERYAWRIALNILRKYRKKGIDLAFGLSAEDIDKVVHGPENLGDYEKGYIEGIEDRKLKAELKGIFSHTYYQLKE